MKKCPFCAEEIQDQALKCKHCGEWIETIVDSHNSRSTGFVGTGSRISLKTKRQPALYLKDISLLKVTIVIILIPTAALLLEFILFLCIGKARIDTTEIGVMVLMLRLSFSTFAAHYAYKFRKLLIIIGISTVVYILYRFMLGVFSFSGLTVQVGLRPILLSAIVPSVEIFGFMALLCMLFRHYESKLDYAEVNNIHEANEPETGKLISRGTCSKCGGITIIARERRLSMYFGTSHKYFCDNCKRYVMGNPFNSIFIGVGEAALSVLFMLMLALFMPKKTTSNIYGFFFIPLIVGIYDGIRRTILGIIGFGRALKQKNV